MRLLKNTHLISMCAYFTVYQKLVGIYHIYIPVISQSDYSICYNYDLIQIFIRGRERGRGGKEGRE